MVKQIISKLIAHKAGIMLGGACVGVVVTAVMAVKDSRKHEKAYLIAEAKKDRELSDDDIEKMIKEQGFEEEYDGENLPSDFKYLTKKEELIIFAKSYWRTGLSMAVTLSLMIFSHVSMAKELAATAAALGVISTKYKELDAELKKQAPEIHKKVHDILDERAIRGKLAEDTREIKDEEERYYEEFSEQVFFATPAQIKEAECELNKQLINTGECTLFTYLASFPKSSGIKLFDWMKHVGWYEGDTSYSYNSGYFGSYVNPEIVNEPITINGKTFDVNKIRWSHCIDFDPELDNNEIGCLEQEIGIA